MPPGADALRALDLELLRSHAFKRRERPVQHVVQTVELTRALDAQNIGCLLDHAQHLLVAVGVAAKYAQVAVADVVADAAEAQLVLHVEQGLGKLFGVLARGTQDMKRQPLRGLLADARQAFEFVDQPRQRFREIRHGLE